VDDASGGWNYSATVEIVLLTSKKKVESRKSGSAKLRTSLLETSCRVMMITCTRSPKNGKGVVSL
jgi:hypothetical protein